MAATRFQAEILQRLACLRIEGGQTYGTLFCGTDEELREALDAGRIVFHEGHIGGAWPQIVAR